MSLATWGKRVAWGLAIALAIWGLDRICRIPGGDGRPFVNLYLYQILVSIAVNVVAAVSLQLVNGVTGQFSIGHAGFMAVGAYTAAAFTYFVGRGLVESMGGGDLAQGVALLVALVLAMAAAAVAGLLVGIPSLRLRGDYLAIVTLGFGEIIRVLILNIDAVGGARGFVGVPQWTSFTGGWIAAAATVVVIWNICDSTWGRAMLAVREDEIAAAAMGVATTRTKVLAFVISSAFAGLAGGLFAHLYYLSPATFTFIKSIEIVMMIIIGGLGSITGAVFGGIVMTILPELLRPSALFAFLPRESRPTLDLRMVIYSLLIVLIIRFRPRGLLGHRELPDIIARLRSRKGRPS